MSMYIRYVVTGDRAVTLLELEQALRQVDPAYAIGGGLVRFGEAACGVIDVTPRGDPICDNDLDLLARRAARNRESAVILAAVRAANCLVCVQPLTGTEAGTDAVLAPLWDWLLANRPGLLAREGGGFFNQAGALK